jgi:hypothetical protein
MISARMNQAKAAGVRQDMADGDRLFSPRRKFRNDVRDAIIKVQPPALHQLRDRDGGDGLGRREPQHQRVRRHRDAGAGFADRKISDNLVVMRNENLRADMEAGGDAIGQDLLRLTEIFRRVRIHLRHASTAHRDVC